MSLKDCLTECLTEQEKVLEQKSDVCSENNIAMLKDLIDRLKLDGEDRTCTDVAILYSLSMLKRAIETDMIKPEDYRGIFNREKPFYTERFRFWPFGGEEYYFDRNCFRNKKGYRTKIKIFNCLAPFDILNYCSLK